MAAHDEAKDGKGLATNYGLYNLSLDLIQDSGYSGDLDTSKWNNSLDHVEDATNIILDYLRGDAPRKNIARHVQQATNLAPRHAVLFAGGSCVCAAHVPAVDLGGVDHSCHGVNVDMPNASGVTPVFHSHLIKDRRLGSAS